MKMIAIVNTVCISRKVASKKGNIYKHRHKSMKFSLLYAYVI